MGSQEVGSMTKKTKQISSKGKVSCPLFLVYFDGSPRAAYPRRLQAEVYSSGFSRKAEIVEGTFTAIRPKKVKKTEVDFNDLSDRKKWDTWKDQKGIWKCKSCKTVMEDGPQSPGPFRASMIVCGECDGELTRRTGGGQSNPFGWLLERS